jgi:outer membrane protein, multidrug efflux system
MRARFPLLFLALTTASSPALAQPAPPSPPQLPSPGSEAPIVIPPLPDVNDPMLIPMPPAPRNLATLEEALTLVKARSTDLRIAYLETERAAGQTRVALAGLLTTINGNASVTQNLIIKRTNQPGFVNGTLGTVSVAAPQPDPWLTGGLTVIQPLVNVRNYHSWKTAEEVEKIAHLNVEDTQRNLSLNLANSLVGVVTAERVAELNRAGFRTTLERLDLTRRRRTLGAATGLDVARAQLDVESARANIVTGDESLRQAREALGLAVGLPQQVGVSKELNIDGLERAALSACRVAPSLEARPDIAAARQRVLVADRNHDNVKLQFLPTLNAVSGLNATTLDTGGAYNTSWNIQAVLAVPLWEGGARYGLLRDTEAQTREAEMNLEALRRNATVQLEQARRGVSVAEASLKVAADHRALAAETDRLVRAGYAEGQFTSLDLVTAAATLRQADIDLALKEFGLVQARILAILSLATCPW